jgi:hypothetical protein
MDSTANDGKCSHRQQESIFLNYIYALYVLSTGITAVDTHEQRFKMMAENRRLTNYTQWMISV